MAALQRLAFMDLQDMELSVLPDWLFSLPRLQEVVVDGNDLTSIPASIGNARALRVFSARYNFIEALPASLASCVDLEELILEGNNITAVPDWIGGLTELTMLWLSSNNISELPGTIANLKQLEEFGFDHNDLKTYPGVIDVIPRSCLVKMHRNPFNECRADDLEASARAGRPHIIPRRLAHGEVGAIDKHLMIGPSAMWARVMLCAGIQSAETAKRKDRENERLAGFHDACMLFKQSLEIKPTADAWNALGNLYALIERHIDAQKCFVWAAQMEKMEQDIAILDTLDHCEHDHHRVGTGDAFVRIPP